MSEESHTIRVHTYSRVIGWCFDLPRTLITVTRIAYNLYQKKTEDNYSWVR